VAGYKGSTIFLVLIISAVFLFFVITLPSHRIWNYEKTSDETIQSQDEDNYGGKTPEETFNMFVGALENNDFEMASRYFIIEKQKVWLKTLQEYADNNVLGEFIKEIKNAKEKINFQKYPNEIWKIKDL